MEFGVQQGLVHVEDEKFAARGFTKVHRALSDFLWSRPRQHGANTQQVNHIFVDQVLYIRLLVVFFGRKASFLRGLDFFVEHLFRVFFAVERGFDR